MKISDSEWEELKCLYYTKNKKNWEKVDKTFGRKTVKNLCVSCMRRFDGCPYYSDGSEATEKCNLYLSEDDADYYFFETIYEGENND